ncbi:hypothetical protein SNE40_004296 [Patella caerulea]|uniref:CCHC-type domain-containing protein n=1 Tax=Patella caerulea TaxID=87958 RepID=A0AAN8KBF7_PATCE
MGEFTAKIKITEDDIDRDILERTVRVFVSGDDRVWRTGIVKAISTIIPKENIIAIDKRGSFREWFVTVSSRNDVELLDIAGCYETEHSRFDFSPSDKRRVEFRVHRAPRFLKQNVLSQVFAPHGRIISITELTSSEPGAMNLRNGIKVVKMEMREDKMAAVPHLLESEDGTYKLLITSRDRAPLCLKCKCLGHVASNCAYNNIQNPNLYSSRVISQADNYNVDLVSSDTSSDTGSFLSSRDGENMEEDKNEEVAERKDDNSLEVKEKSTDQGIIQTVGDENKKGENDTVIDQEAALVEKMAFSDSWPEEVEREERERKKNDRENAKRKAGYANEISNKEGEKRRRDKKQKPK